jgi:hypothetical protein
MNRTLRRAVFAAVLAGCTEPRESAPVAPPQESVSAAVVRPPLSEPAPLAPAGALLAPPAAGGTPVVVPPGAIYVCVSESGGARTQTSIEFAPKVEAMCAKHPEMGPCRYERDACRRAGGRVYAAGGAEVTAQTEAEYDRKVMRARFEAN